MRLQVPFLSDRPVLAWELVRVTRQPWFHIVRYSLVAWLILQFLVAQSQSRRSPDRFDAPWLARGEGGQATPLLEIRRQEAIAWTTFWNGYAPFLLQQQLVLMLLLIPAVMAGGLGHEKERDTLLALFGTQLASWEIVIGKLLGRLPLVLAPALASLPFLVFGTVSAELSLARILLALALVIVLALALAAASMITSVWTRRTGDAILACYAAIVVAYFVSQIFLAETPFPAWLDPFKVLDQIVTGSGLWQLALLMQVAVWGGLGAICLALAAWRLRPAGLRQREQRPRRGLWAFRRPVGNNPIRWRERQVIGLAPLPWLRMVPTWMGLLGVFSFSAILACDAINSATGRIFFDALRRGRFVFAYQWLQRMSAGQVHQGVFLMGIVLLLVGTIIVGVRCGGSIAEEKRRKTWEDLLLTPLSQAAIMRGKWQGVLLAAVPYMVVYALPMFGLAALGGQSAVIHAGIWLAVASLAMAIAGWVGVGLAAGDPQGRWNVAGELTELIDLARVVWESRPKHDPTKVELRLLKRHRALPVYGDASGALLLRPDGQILEVVWGAETVARPADPQRRMIALVSAAKVYPVLRVLLPLRPHRAANCQECGGSGLLRTPDQSRRLLCQNCAGLGWMVDNPTSALSAEPAR